MTRQVNEKDKMKGRMEDMNEEEEEKKRERAGKEKREGTQIGGGKESKACKRGEEERK